MKMTRTLLVAAVAAAGLAATSAEAERHGGSGHSGGWSGHHGGASVGRHWSGGHGYWGGSRYWGPRYGFYVGAPLLFGSYYWGGPWWDGYYYPRSTVVYTDRVVVPYSEPYPEGEVRSTEVPRSEGAPSQAPAYRNYCESEKAYYPKVTKCPEGWRFEPSR